MRSNIDKEKTKKTIARALENIKTEADPWLLAEYLSLYKKEVPLFHRSKVAAYLLMLCEQGKGIRLDGPPARRNDSARQDRNARRAGGERRSASAERTAPADRAARDEGRGGDSQRFPLAEEESRRLFFSVGRSRRVFPREILGLINSKTSISKDDIGAIRILDNYSFVQVRDTVAEQIIEALNGMSFRGRPLTVNYAKSRKDEENGAFVGAAENESEAYAAEGEDESEAFDEYAESESPGQDHGDETGDAQEYEAEDADRDSEQGHDHPEEENI